MKRFCSLMYYQPLKIDQTIKIIMKKNFKPKYYIKWKRKKYVSRLEVGGAAVRANKQANKYY